ncbi:hypothetical protein [Flavobacterium anhuiense]|uniref:hypothetical protein n=1 Tax=Flavobacterium anhuiense TaxID=459526 RepID=UPI0020266437|nr:hypothetical protein [Flavobacterium anhuiense]URM38798.1 hypothetical protein LLY39_09855 [Flavobacterium anhuiense]
MKKILMLLILLLILSCTKNQTKDNKIRETPYKIDSSKTESSEELSIDYPVPPVNFLEEKYKKNGYFLPDNNPSFPSYTFFDKSLGGFSVNYVGKSKLIQDYWNVNNSTGFFSQFENIDIAFEDSKQLGDKIRDILSNKPNDYYVVANFLPKEAISKYYDDGSGEFDLKDKAYTYFYIYENNNWTFIKKILTQKLAGQGISLYNDLLLFHKFKNIKPFQEIFQGTFKVETEGEYTTNGEGHTTYYFTITENKIVLKAEAFKGDFVCEGNYKGIQENDILGLYYNETDNRCISLSPTYLIKKEKDKFFIKGVGGEGTINNWIELKKD